MCIACYVQGNGFAAYEAAVLVGGPIAYAGYRRVRAALGLRDTAAVPVAQPPRPAHSGRSAAGTAWASTSASMMATTSGQN